MIHKVVQFNREVIGIPQRSKVPMAAAEAGWLHLALEEELSELTIAETLTDKVDALCDLIYFAIGGMYRMGLSVQEIEECFSAVHDANMTKRKGVKETRGHELDAVKPDGWLSPEERIYKILGG